MFLQLLMGIIYNQLVNFMKTKHLIVLIGVTLLCLTDLAQASLIVDGTVFYRGQERKVIYDTEQDITWLDYRNDDSIWDNQVTWAAGLSFEINSLVFNNWRLPATIDGLFEYGFDGTTTGGYNITTSELGHLYYVDLGNKGAIDIDGNIVSSEIAGLKNTGVFESLINARYWSGTEYSALSEVVWVLESWGYQNITGIYSLNPAYGIAVHDGRIYSAVPVPETIWLFGSGLTVVIGLRRKNK